MAWSCSQCRTTDVAVYYSSGRMAKCKDCQRFYNLRVNAKPRARGRTPRLLITEAEFLDWCRQSERRCAYCSIGEVELARIGLKTQIGRDLAALGIDRVANAGDYTLSNIALCCFACNKAKGNVFTSAEMKVIGEAIARVWDTRLAAAPVDSPAA